MDEPQEIGSVIRVAFDYDLTIPPIPADVEITLVRVPGIGMTENMPWVYCSAGDLNPSSYPKVQSVFSWTFLLVNCRFIKVGEFV